MAQETYREVIDRVLSQSHGIDLTRAVETLVAVLVARHQTCRKAREGLTLERPGVDPLLVLQQFLYEAISGCEEAAAVLTGEDEPALSDADYFQRLLCGNRANELDVIWKILVACQLESEDDEAEATGPVEAPSPPPGLRLAE